MRWGARRECERAWEREGRGEGIEREKKGGGENIYVKGQKQKKCFVKKIEILEISRVAKAGKTEEGRPKAAQRGRGGRFGGVGGG